MGLDWEEGVFSLILRVGRMFRRTPTDPSHLVRLATLERRLTLIAQMISGMPVRVRAAEGVGGIAGDDLLMPQALDVHPTSSANRRCYLLRALVGGIVVRDRLDEAGSPGAWVLAEERLLADLPGAATWLAEEQADQERLGPDAPIWYRGDLHGGAARIPGTAGRTAPQAITGTEMEAPVRDRVTVVDLDERENGKSVLKAPFEQVETIDSWRGGSRDADASDELAAHAEALDACDIREVIRGGEAPRSLYRCDLLVDADVGDSGVEDLPGIPYDEWNHRTKAYRRGWCTVLPGRWLDVDAVWSRAARRRLRPTVLLARSLIAAARERLREQPRQADGEEIDLEAWTRECAERAAGHGGEQRLYRRLARRRREWATTVLIDVSLSADSGVGGMRVLDVSRDAVEVLGQLCETFGDDLEVLAFASQTRNRCWVWELGRSGEPWRTISERLGGLVPRGYTRIGPALRHATARLGRRNAERKLLFLLSDGKPTDHDRYEGRYGIADIRRAVHEATATGVHLHAFAIDAAARSHLPAQFGTGCWSILPRVEGLPEALAGVYARLTAV